MIDEGKPIFLFELFTKLPQGFVTVVGIVNCVTGGMNFIDGDMNMQVVSIIMNSTNALMLTITQPIA